MEGVPCCKASSSGDRPVLRRLKVKLKGKASAENIHYKSNVYIA